MESGLQNKRIWELDFLRGTALLLMVYFHIVFDLKELYGYDIAYASGINFYIGKASAILFMLISGVSCSLSRNNVKRGLRILGAALIITLATWLFNPEYIIVFGILHFFGVSMLLYPLVSKLGKYVLLLLGTVLILLGGYVSGLNPGHNYFFILGITSNNFISSDYYPLIPWFGVFVYGIAAGRFLYARKQSLFPFVLRNNIISLAGRRTLLIYLLHQPVILLSLMLISRLR